MKKYIVFLCACLIAFATSVQAKSHDPHKHHNDDLHTAAVITDIVADAVSIASDVSTMGQPHPVVVSANPVPPPAPVVVDPVPPPPPAPVIVDPVPPPTPIIIDPVPPPAPVIVSTPVHPQPKHNPPKVEKRHDHQHHAPTSKHGKDGKQAGKKDHKNHP